VHNQKVRRIALYLITELPEEDRNNVRKVMRKLEERIIIESLTQPSDTDELRKLIDKPLSEIYEREVSDKPRNRFMPIRKLSVSREK
jgi:hypothetical protein